jgi:hypothetical protein
MTKCNRCNNHEGLWTVKNKSSSKEETICVWCELPDDVLIKAPTIIDIDGIPINSTSLNNIEYGRLHLVNRTIKSAICRVCDKTIPTKSKCYNQSMKDIKVSFFPTQTKVCFECGEKLIKEGAEVVIK